jgi:hypothetical protein
MPLKADASARTITGHQFTRMAFDATIGQGQPKPTPAIEAAAAANCRSRVVLSRAAPRACCGRKARVRLLTRAAPGLTVAYQSPCSMQHGQKIVCEPVELPERATGGPRPEALASVPDHH